MVKKGNYTCMYCKKKYKRGRNPNCCNQCLLVRDYCLKPDCNEFSILRKGYNDPTQGKYKYLALAVIEGERIAKHDKWMKENEDLHEGDQHHLFNHCSKCYDKILEE